MRFCLCIFESDTVKSDCPIQILVYDKIFKDLIQTVGLPITSFTNTGDIKKSSENIKKKTKKKTLKMTSQLVIFRAFLFIFFHPPTLDLKKNSRNSTNKKNLALVSYNRRFGSITLWPFSHFVDLFVRVRTDLEKSWKMTFAWKNHGILIFHALS